ncbi:hypothetical protein A33I_17770 [Alkalihalophilus marmarensis DSM 21297]|uniref:Uncharacterized protein n=1 Tax=Alkalihalophilus marmarensis DSM 21297 TaxID=1188261 RepID=U6SMH2_9BACI|nr:hypothetical protein A33I_17770 [Alkalihalophilus marmarensis DSM 21297]
MLAGKTVLLGTVFFCAVGEEGESEQSGAFIALSDA